jgi:hypothetical protein
VRERRDVRELNVAMLAGSCVACGFLECACGVAHHDAACLLKRAACFPFELLCRHGSHVCDVCTPRTCQALESGAVGD